MVSALVNCNLSGFLRRFTCFHKTGHWEAADCLQHLNQRGFTHVVLSPEPPAELSAEPIEMVFESQMGLESQAVETGCHGVRFLDSVSIRCQLPSSDDFLFVRIAERLLLCCSMLYLAMPFIWWVFSWSRFYQAQEISPAWRIVCVSLSVGTMAGLRCAMRPEAPGTSGPTSCLQLCCSDPGWAGSTTVGSHRVALGEWFNVALLACDSLRNSSSKSWGFTPQEQLAYVKWCTAVGIPRFVCGDLLRNAKDVCKFIEVLVHSFPDTVKGTFL